MISINQIKSECCYFTFSISLLFVASLKCWISNIMLQLVYFTFWCSINAVQYICFALIPKRMLTIDTVPSYKYSKFKPHYVFSNVLKCTSAGIQVHACDIFRSKWRFHTKELFEKRIVVVFWSSIWFVHGNTTDPNSFFLCFVLVETQVRDTIWTLCMWNTPQFMAEWHFLHV